MRSSLFCAALFALGLVACDGGDGSSCVLDSDCPVFAQACIEGVCRTPGEMSEAGTPRMDAGDPVDAGEPMDAAPVDAPLVDATPMDATPTDGMVAELDAMPTDGPVASCEMIADAWTIALVTPSADCGGAIAASPVIILESAVTPCTFDVTSTSGTAITGSFALASDNMLLGTLTPGTGVPTACSGTYTPATPSFAIICDACVMNLNAP